MENTTRIYSPFMVKSTAKFSKKFIKSKQLSTKEKDDEMLRRFSITEKVENRSSLASFNGPIIDNGFGSSRIESQSACSIKRNPRAA